MVKVEEHKARIKEIEEQISKAQSPQRKQQLTKHLHRLKKQLFVCNRYLGVEQGKSPKMG